MKTSLAASIQACGDVMCVQSAFLAKIFKDCLFTTKLNGTDITYLKFKLQTLKPAKNK